MAFEISRLLEQCTYFWRRRATRTGLATLLLGLNFVVVPSTFALGDLILGKLGLLTTPADYRHWLTWGAVGVALANTMGGLLWLWWRVPPRAKAGAVAIYFAPNHSKDGDELVSQLYSGFCAYLVASGLDKRFSPHLIPHGHLVTDGGSANRFLAASGGRLIIYGSIEGGQVSGEKVQGFRSLGMAVRHRILNETELVPYARDISGSLVDRSFLVRESNSILDRELVARHLGEVTRFLVGAALTLDGQGAAGIQILRTLYQEIRHDRGQRSGPARLFENSVASFLRSALYNEFNATYDAHVVDQITTADADSAVHQCTSLLDELAALDGNDSPTDLLRAILAFHQGKVAEARALVQASQRHLPQSSPAPHLSLAFLSLWEHDYSAALRHYNRATRCPDLDLQTIISVVRFLDSIADRHPGRTYLRFGLAFVNDRFYDRDRAIQEYERFIEESRDDQSLGLLRQNATSRVDQLKQAPGGEERT